MFIGPASACGACETKEYYIILVKAYETKEYFGQRKFLHSLWVCETKEYIIYTEN